MTQKDKNKKESFYLNNKIVADVYYRDGDNSVIPYLKKFTERYKQLVQFFGVQPPKIHIHFIYTRVKMDECWDGKSPRWICGSVNPKNIYEIYIFSPLVFEKLTIHKKHEILPTIIHEIAHTFVSLINKRCFAWANEGVCQYVEGKNVCDNMVKKEDWEWFKENKVLINSTIPWLRVAEHEGYKIAYLIVRYIIKLRGKQAIIDILSIRRTNRNKQIEQKMSKILKNDLDKFLLGFEKTLYKKEK